MEKELNQEISTPATVEAVDQRAIVDVDYVDGVLSNVRSFCSFKAESREDKIVFANAMNNPTHRISDKINEVIFIKDVYVEELKMTQEATGAVVNVPRIVLFGHDGQSYQAVSVGLYSALNKIITAFGQPTWEEPIAVKIKQVSRKDRKMLTLECVSAKLPK